MAESLEHSELKSEIRRICERIGFKVGIEARIGRTRVDALATRGNRSVAFEIQWSPQTISKTAIRQQKYRDLGIEGCWLFREPHAKRSGKHNETPTLPIFLVSGGNWEYRVSLIDKRRIVPLEEFLSAFLLNGIRFCSNARTMDRQKARAMFFPMKCWRCHAANHVFYLEPYYSSCNFKLEEMASLWSGERPEFRPEILSVVQKALLDGSLDIKMGAIKVRHSKTANSAYRSFGCFKCDSIFGDWFVRGAVMEAIYADDNIPLEAEVSIEPPIELPVPHWCFPASPGNWCQQLSL